MLPINSNFETIQLSKQRYGSFDASICGGAEEVVAEEYTSGCEEAVGPGYIGPGGVKVMTRVHFNQIPEYAPLAQLIQNRPGRKRYG